MIAYGATDRDGNDYIELFPDDDSRERLGVISIVIHVPGTFKPDRDKVDHICRLIRGAINSDHDRIK